MAVNKIEIALKEALKKAMVKCNFVEDYEIDQITIEIPKEKSHGDYSTNIAMQLTRLLRKNPRMIAEQLIEAIDKEEKMIMEKVMQEKELNIMLNSFLPIQQEIYI